MSRATPEHTLGGDHEGYREMSDRKSEFGHVSARCGDAIIDAWGVGPFVITADDGREYRFEDSDRFGPSLTKKNGDLLANPWPSENSPFWRAHRIWVRQGRRTKEDGCICIWDEPKPQTLKRISRKDAIVIDHGEEDGKTIWA